MVFFGDNTHRLAFGVGKKLVETGEAGGGNQDVLLVQHGVLRFVHIGRCSPMSAFQNRELSPFSKHFPCS